MSVSAIRLLLLLLLTTCFSMSFAQVDLVSHAHRFARECGLNDEPQMEFRFRQAWQTQPSSGFSPACVHAYGDSRGLHIIATLEDRDIFNDATGLNQETWKLGDVFEIFLGVSGSERYWELHVTPDNHRLQLNWTESQLADFFQKRSTLDQHIITDAEFLFSRTFVNREENYWQVYVFIRWEVLGLDAGGNAYALEVAFCRYDATRGCADPVLSSTAPLTRPSYHRRKEWHQIDFIIRR